MKTVGIIRFHISPCRVHNNNYVVSQERIRPGTLMETQKVCQDFNYTYVRVHVDQAEVKFWAYRGERCRGESGCTALKRPLHGFPKQLIHVRPACNSQSSYNFAVCPFPEGNSAPRGLKRDRNVPVPAPHFLFSHGTPVQRSTPLPWI